MSENKFFVYGTLKVGGRFAAYFDKIRTSSKPATLMHHDLFGIGPIGHAPFPGAVPGTGNIVGEVHEYEGANIRSVLRSLDSIEGYHEDDEESSLYLRTKKKVVLEDGEEVDAFVYIFNKKIASHYHKLEEGVWEV